MLGAATAARAVGLGIAARSDCGGAPLVAPSDRARARNVPEVLRRLHRLALQTLLVACAAACALERPALAQSFRMVAPLPIPPGSGSVGFAPTLLPSGRVLLTGGFSFGVRAMLYDPSVDAWSDAPSMQVERINHTATVLTNGNVIVVGGQNPWGILGAEIYDTTTGTWSAAGSIGTVRFCHTATLLQNGKVLIAGGLCGKFGSPRCATEEKGTANRASKLNSIIRVRKR